ncbi:unnamed protein product [Pedinophyceae sp. YPF-701]|nr:unnamed protein product [Pedinophyceae sp. YPF-701]
MGSSGGGKRGSDGGMPSIETVVSSDSARLAAQAVLLFVGVLWHTAMVVAALPLLLVQNALLSIAPGKTREPSSSVRFYKGKVTHTRHSPKEHSFTYAVRMAVVSLDRPPTWFAGQQRDHLTADAARAATGTRGRVELLTHPACLGYVQNPISVYYCHDEDGVLRACIAEVTNTPWAERTSFVFRPGQPGGGERVRKALHVSPLMDMDAKWRIDTAEPGERLRLSVLCTEHPTLRGPTRGGGFFGAWLEGELDRERPAARNEEAGLGTLLRYGFQPHRVAWWIYSQAVTLLWKGVPFYGPPGLGPLCSACRGSAHGHPKRADTQEFFWWAPAKGWPWQT